MSRSSRTDGALRMQLLCAWLLGLLACRAAAGAPALHAPPPAPLPAASGRALLTVDGWATAAICAFAPTAANSKADASGRLWGWQAGASCAFKDEQQQALYPNKATPLQQWSDALACPEAPSAANSAPDSHYHALWGVWFAKSCAFKTSSGQPAYYVGYSGPRYVPGTLPPIAPSPAAVLTPSLSPVPVATKPPSPSPAPVATKPPSPSPASPVAARPQSPSPTPAAAAQPPSPSPAPAAAKPPSPSPAAAAPVPVAPASSGGGSCTCENVKVDASAIASIIAAQLWQKLADATNGYEMSAAEAPSGSPAPAASAQQLAASLLAAAVRAAAASTASPASPGPNPADQAATSAIPAVRPSDNLHVMDWLDANTTAAALPPAAALAPAAASTNPAAAEAQAANASIPSGSFIGIEKAGQT